MGVSRIHLAYSPYPASVLSAVDFVQSSTTLTFVHLNYPPYKLTRNDHTDWVFTAITFAPGIDPPENVSAAATQPNSTDAIAVDYTYYVTAINAEGQESRASTGDTVTNDLSLQGNYNTVSWDAVDDAEWYTVYRGDNSTPGYIGMVEAPATSFKDRNLLAILSDTPPRATNPFDGEGNYPSSTSLHQQRQVFGRTATRPNAVFASQSAAPENMDVSRPAKADDALSFAIVSDKVNSVNQLVSMKKDLMVMGSDAIFSVKGSDGGVLTPASIDPQRESGQGSSRLKPIVVDSVLFYQPEKSRGVRAMGFTFELDGYRSNNVAIFSPHLFKAKRIVSWAYQSEPYSCIWAVLDSEELLCFTWEEEHQVWGWTRMEIDGFVEQVTVIHEGGYDRLYALIRRTINDVERRFHERLALPHEDELAVACHLDCAVTQISETPSAVIDQLWHLEGATISAVCDGFVFEDLVVENGQVTLPHEFNVRTAGLPYEGLVELLPPPLQTSGGSHHVSRQALGDVTIRTVETRGLEISTDGENFDPLPEMVDEITGVLTTEETTDFKAGAPSNWTDGATLTIRQRQPVPAHITAAFIEYHIGEADEN